MCHIICFLLFFFFSSRRRHTRLTCDWSSDVCSSDLPAILLMDEPLSALDSQTRELLMEDFVRLLADGGMGAVYVTHNLEEAARLADRIVVLSRRPGRIREVVTVPMTRTERGETAAREKLLALQNQIWSLIRNEAIDAEREVQHA